MDFKEFVNKLEQDLKDAMADISPGATVDVRSMEKLQEGSYTGITISPAGGNVGMNLNANQLFDQMQDGQSYEGVLAVAVSTAERGLHDMPAVDVSELMNYEAAKKYLCFDVVGSDRNADMLEKVPHTDKENISMVYRLQLDSTENGAATVLITNAMMEQFGVTKEQLHADAMENAQEIRPADFRTMAAVMAEMMGMPEEMMADMAPPMYVATNQDKVQGAAVMFYPDFMDQAAKELGGDIFILPSSVHEVLILPDDGNMNAQELKEMVTSINASEVSPEDRLTDSVYHYDAQERIFELGEKFEERQAEKMAAKEERSSVLKDLQDKKQDMDLKPKTPTPHKSKNEQSIG
ncbi:MAG: DUF5688 family protein [Blautia sp.]|uniref:DUF5688 family protein n=1 Tax=Blautia sp. TaxID=1955243 RepID=UPI002A8300F1|nr:DUF5688 family protein [Blautia sp.]MDY4054307.1 DUF5688 family protein [Blautia sp.]